MSIKRFAVVLLFAATALYPEGCSRNVYVPVEGDLVFVVSGTSEYSKAITDATGRGAVEETAADYVHMGIVAVEDGEAFVLEASSKSGVVLTPWEEFLSDAPKVGGRPGVSVMRVREDSDKAALVAGEHAGFSPSAAVSRAKEHLGEPYDWYFMPDNGRMYCSELVWESYLWEDGSRVFDAVPMNFRDAEGNMPDFWIHLYITLGEPIPEGVPGTNPNALAADPSLFVVHRFF